MTIISSAFSRVQETDRRPDASRFQSEQSSCIEDTCGFCTIDLDVAKLGTIGRREGEVVKTWAYFLIVKSRVECLYTRRIPVMAMNPII